MFCPLFPLISDVTMGDKRLEDEAASSAASKPLLLTSRQMRKVLDDLGTDSVAENKSEAEEDEDCGEEETEFSRVLAEIPDLEGDYSELSLGFSEELCLASSCGPGPALDTAPAPAPPPLLLQAEASAGDQTEAGQKLLRLAQKVVVHKTAPDEGGRPGSSCSSPPVMSPADTAGQEKAAPQLPPAVNIHRGDLIEFLVGERTWFLVEVTGRGKLGGKNQNYLNVRYSDRSEGGVFIDQHQWRIVRRRETVALEQQQEEAGAAAAVSRLHRVTVDLSSCELSCEDTADTATTDTTDTEGEGAGGGTQGEGQSGARITTRKRKRRKKRRDRMRKVSVDESVFDPSNNIKKGDIIEYIVKEEDGKGADLVFRVEVLSRGKSSGRNKNYLNIRYSDGSTGGVFIDRHQWRVVSSQSQ